MPFLQELMSGQQKPTAQEMAGGIPQNADPGKKGLLGMRGGNGVLGLRGEPGAGPAMQPPPVQAAAVPDMANAPAQMIPQSAPVAPAAPPPGAPMQGMGGPMGAGGPPMGPPPQMQGNPQLLQALLARQAMAQGAR